MSFAVQFFFIGLPIKSLVYALLMTIQEINKLDAYPQDFNLHTV